MKVRPHRGSLKSSLRDMVEIEPTVEALVNHINMMDEMMVVTADDLAFTEYGHDSRIKDDPMWYLITFKEESKWIGVWGMCTEDLNE